MGTLSAGSVFPSFAIGGLSLPAALRARPHLLVVWRAGCPTCQLALPFFDRMQHAYPAAAVIGLAQENASTLAGFIAESGISFQQLPDEELKVTRLLGVQTVPSYWLLDFDGKVVMDGEGWDRARLEAIGERLASMVDSEVRPLVRDEDGVPTFKPG